MKLIVGLGNPGNQYAHNRHNIGFMCLSYFAKEHGWGFEKKEGLARTARGRIDATEVTLARPQTFMNASGEAVKKLTVKYRIKPKDLIVVHDEMDLKLGSVRIRRGGSSAGHNGIESIIADLGTADFVRVRVGVGHPRDNSSEGQAHVVRYVLGDFGPDEAETIKKVIAEVSQALVALIQGGLDEAMNRFNKTNTPKPEKAEKIKNAPEAKSKKTPLVE